MNLDPIIQEVINSSSFREYLSEKLAEAVSIQYHYQDPEGELIRKEIRTILREEAEKIVREWKDYFESSSLDELIRDEIKKFTKAEIIAIFSSQPL